MDNRRIRKGIRLKDDVAAAIEAFMSLAEENLAEGSAPKKSVARNFTQAMLYLISSFYDQREYVSRGAFDRSLLELAELLKTTLVAGNKLNDFNKSIFTNTGTNIQMSALISELDSIFTANEMILKTLRASFEVRK